IGITVLPGRNFSDDSHYTLLAHVTDTGVGIRSENLTKIFTMFEQEDSSMTRRFGGAGLGLAIAKSLCKQMNGDISVESVHGVGSRFSFTAEFQTVDNSGIEINGQPSSLHMVGTGYTILIVEDDENSMKYLTTLIQRAGFKTRRSRDHDCS
ncbi:MAG: ATP-binding protein, partial [Verrucomicrobiota bacterium]